VLTEVTTWYLEMVDPADLRAAPPVAGAQVLRVGQRSPELSRFLYTAVGGDWYWLDRLPWTFAEWTAWLERPGVETWIAWLDGNPAGYVELEDQPAAGPEPRQTQIVYFGLLAPFTGRGLGGHLLTEALRRGFALGAERVWVHTCSLDSPVARGNYEARGMRCYDTRVTYEDLPERPPGPWSGAR
jgi:RimJ/RimL family protein N-acetyltransferase